MKTKDAIKTGPLWLISASYFFVSLLNVFISDFNKPFGQQYIKDDIFFGTVASVTSIFNGSARIVWGFMYDKFGFQYCLVIISCVCTMISFSLGNLSFIGYYSSEDSAKAFYVIWMCTFYAFMPGAYGNYPAATGRAYGPKYCNNNYGLILVTGVI